MHKTQNWTQDLVNEILNMKLFFKKPEIPGRITMTAYQLLKVNNNLTVLSLSCLYCNNIDDIKYFLLSCEKTRNFWQSFLLWWNRINDTKITLHYEFLEESILFGFQMNVEVFDILNYCILNGKFYIHKLKLFHENELDFYEYLWELKYKLQIERMICNGTNNDEQFSKFLFIYHAL